MPKDFASISIGASYGGYKPLSEKENKLDKTIDYGFKPPSEKPVS